MNIAVIYGGKSGEHEVSLVSASSIARNIPAGQNRVILVGIDKEGSWYLQENAMLDELRANPKFVLSIRRDDAKRISVVPGGGSGAFLCEGRAIPVDVAFPVLHGTFGEDGTIQGLFEMADIPYVGGGVMASGIAMDKEKTKILWRAEGLPVLPFVAAKRSDWLNVAKKASIVAEAERVLSWPLFVKPACAGSSVGAAKATNGDELKKRANDAFMWDDKIIIEPFIKAREIECSVTGNEEPVAYAPGEIIPTHEFYDYDAKYTDPDGAALRIPAELPERTAEQVRDIAVRAYRALNLSGLARVDFFIDKKDGALYLNEINTMSGFTPISMFPKMCEASGLSYGKLVMTLIDLAKRRFEARRSLRTSRQ